MLSLRGGMLQSKACAEQGRAALQSGVWALAAAAVDDPGRSCDDKPPLQDFRAV